MDTETVLMIVIWEGMDDEEKRKEVQIDGYRLATGM